MLLRPECNHPEVVAQTKEGLAQIEHLLMSRPTMAGTQRHSTHPRQVQAFNSEVPSQKVESSDCPLWTDIDTKPPYVVGDEAMYIPKNSGYRLSWPMRQGRLHTHVGPGGSLTSVMADLEVIWGHVLQELMEVPLKDLKHYKAVLLISDIYCHSHVKSLVSLLLDSLGFGAIIVHQESVCATYGSGIAAACVVDVGDQKVSVSCIEDGLSHRASRITLCYGGIDVSRLFHTLLRRCGVTLPEVDLRSPCDVVQLQALKETCCHLNQDQGGISQHSLEILKPEAGKVKYCVRLGDETIIAPMALLRPQAFGLQGPGLIHTQGRFESDPEDPYDDNYLRQTQRQSWAGRKKDDPEMSRDQGEQNLSQIDDLGGDDEDSNEVPDVLNTTESIKLPRRREEEEEEDMDEDSDLHLMGVDEAIVHSISKCDSEELRRRMYSCILVVGGGLQFEGATHWLQYQVWQAMPAQTRLHMESMDIISKPKDVDASLTSWKGGAILACLDSTQELWIWQKEWRQFSTRMLRERTPFIW